MNLAAEINRMTVPQEFSRLCKCLLIAEYGDDFLAIDDDSPDGGNDGYHKYQRKIFAFHCFKRVQNQSINREIFRKMSSDLKKAIDLRKTGLKVEAWTFISNYPIPQQIAEKIIEQGKNAVIDVSWRDNEYLSLKLREFDFVRKDFPILHDHESDQSIEEILSEVDAIKSIVGVGAKPRDIDLDKDTDLTRIYKIQELSRSPELVSEVKSILYETKCPDASIAAVALLDFWYEPDKDLATDIVDHASNGVGLAANINDSSALALMYSIKGKYECLQIKNILDELLPNATLATDLQWDIAGRQLKSLQDKHERDFERAVASLKLGGDWYSIGHAMMHIARGYFFLAEAYKETPSDSGEWHEAYRRVRKFAIGAKDAFEKTEDSNLYAKALFNLGCYLQFGEEPEEAKSVLQKVLNLDDTPEITELKRRVKILEQLAGE